MKPATVAPHTMRILFRETSNRIATYLRLVAEGKCLDEASNFARWLQFSGLMGVLRSNPQPMPLPVDGEKLRLQMEELIAACGEVYAKWGNNPAPQYQKTDIDEIREQLAAITKKLAA